MRESSESASLEVLGRPSFDQLERERVLAEVRRTLFAETTCVRLGRFELRARIGSGAMGVVYSAHDPELDRSVALKVLEPRLASDEGRLRLRREAQALARLSHPNVVTVHEVGTSAGRVYIAMELVEGDSLDHWLARVHPSWPDVLDVLRDAGAGIQAAHERGLVHRDIKPSNIMVDCERRPRVVDFGLAHLDITPKEGGAEGELELTRTRAILGTPAYAAPEQLDGRGADARSDQFSFAATAWEALAGRPPFGGNSVAERLEAIRHGVRVPRGPLGALLRPLGRALAFDPGERYPSMGALLEALARETARPRRRFAPVGIGALLVVGVASAALALRQSSSKVTQPPPRAESSLLAPGAVLACPVLESSGVEAPDAWLGAAAASLACRRARWILGGELDRVLVPAGLLGLARQPDDSQTQAVWERNDVRALTLETARRLGTALVDGRVERRGDGFLVELSLEQPPGRTLASGAGSGKALHLAIRQAFEKLEVAGGLPVAPTVESEVARWTGVTDVHAGALLDELGPALETLPDAPARCTELERSQGLRSFTLAGAFAACDATDDASRRDVALDRSSLPALAATAPAHFFSHPTARGEGKAALAVARELAAARAGERTDIGRAALAWAEAQLHLAAGDNERAAVLLLDLANHTPTLWGLHGALARSTLARRNSKQDHVRRHAYAAWVPESPAAWESMSSAEHFECKDAVAGDCHAAPGRLTFQRRAVDLAPSVPIHSMHLALRLLEVGRSEEARTLAARLSVSPEQRTAVAYILSLADAHEGWLGRALARMQSELGRIESLSANSGGISLMMQAERLAGVLGRRRELADEVADRFVLSERPLPKAWQILVPMVVVCMYAERGVARRCIQKIRTERSDGDRWPGAPEGAELLVRGAERFVAGDAPGAVASWRSLATTGYYFIQLPAEVFDQAGESELASQMDSTHLRQNGPYAGVHPAWAREAKRARLRGDRKRSLRLAHRVIEAWSVADVPVPAVAEMRRLVGG